MISKHFSRLNALIRARIRGVKWSLALLAAAAPNFAFAADQPSKEAKPEAATSNTETTVALDPVAYYQTRVKAYDLFNRAKYAEAEPLFASLIATFSEDGEHWWRWARCHIDAKNFEKAAECYQQAIELGFGDVPSHYHQVAGLNAKLGHSEEAFTWLERMLATRFENRSDLRRDVRLQSLEPKEQIRQVVGLLPDREFTRDEGWRYDLQFLASEVKRLRIDPFASISEVDFDAAVTDIYDQIPNLTDAQIYMRMQQLIARVGDGHTLIRGNNKLLKMVFLPLQFYEFSDGLFIVAASDEHTDLVGAKVLRFGDKTFAEAKDIVKAMVSYDNAMGVTSTTPWFLRNCDVLTEFKLAPDRDHVTLTILDREGQERDVTLSPVKFQPHGRLQPSKLTANPAPLHLKNVEDYFWLEQLADNTLYVQFNVVGDKQSESLRDFATRLNDELTSKKISKLIVDVRHNGGGNTFLTVPLLRTLIHFELSAPDHKLFMIIGRETFSACQNFSTMVDAFTNATFVGEPSGSRPNFIGESTDVQLPYTKLQASVSSKYWQTSWPTDRRMWIAPEIAAELSSSDYFTNRDPAVESILTLISDGHGEQPATASAK